MKVFVKAGSNKKSTKEMNDMLKGGRHCKRQGVARENKERSLGTKQPV
jgi:hypothetical protein